MRLNDDDIPDDIPEETLKPDIPRPHGKKLSPGDALREARETYGDSTAEPNMQDQEDMHHGSDS